jgi:hypothetical protein
MDAADPPTQVESVRITAADGTEYFRDAHETGLTRGDSQLVRSGKTIKVTGHIPLTSEAPKSPGEGFGRAVANGPLVPFEIDATCP